MKLIPDEIIPTLSECMAKWGYDAQAGVCQEECAELIVAISHKRRGRSAPLFDANLVEEIADVLMMAFQMALYVGPEKVEEVFDKKLDRIKMYLEEA